MPRWSLKYSIALTIFLLEAVMIALVLWKTLSVQVDSTREQLDASEQVMLNLLSDMSRVALLTEEFASLQPYMEQIRSDPHVVQVVLTDQAGRVVASSAPLLVGTEMRLFDQHSDHYWRKQEISNAAGTYGSLGIEFSRAALQQATRRALNRGIGLAIAGMAVIAVVGLLIGHVLTRRLARLTAAAVKVAEGDLSVRTGGLGGDEVGVLGRAFDRMADKVERDIRELHAKEERFALAVRATNDGIWDWDVEHGTLYFSPRCKEILGYSPDEEFDTFLAWRDHIHPEDLGRVLELWSGYIDGHVDTYTLEYRLRSKQGDYVWVRARGMASRNTQGEVTRITGSLADITQQRAQAAALEHQALHDSLTDLPNRTLFHDRLHQAVLACHRDKGQLAVLMMDLDRFKEINDTLGHYVGDQVLIQVGRRLRDGLRETDTVARLGGDEFAILVPSASLDEAQRLADKINHMLEQSFVFDVHNIHVGASVGIALFPDHGEDADTLIQRADVAMYVAKNGDSSPAVYDAQQDQYTIKRLSLISALRQALRFNELDLAYQPILDMASARPVGVEALLRWNHPTRGPVAPDEFIPLAEQTGQMGALTDWVLDNALRQAASWTAAGLGVSLSVNLSPRNLQDSGFADRVRAALEQAAVPAERLTLEITESAIMTDPERAGRTLDALDRSGVRLSIDDFGTGYSSLAHLKSLPVDELKIDKSFVIDMNRDENDAVIVRSTVDLAHNLGLTVTAEGVEQRDTWEMLALLDCDRVQGMYVCKPMSAEEMTVWLERQSAPGMRRTAEGGAGGAQSGRSNS